MKLKIDPESLTLGEFDYVEEQSGLTYEDIARGALNTKAIMAFVVVQERRANPGYSIADAAKLRIAEIDITDEADPTGGEASGS